MEPTTYERLASLYPKMANPYGEDAALIDERLALYEDMTFKGSYKTDLSVFDFYEKESVWFCCHQSQIYQKEGQLAIHIDHAASMLDVDPDLIQSLTTPQHSPWITYADVAAYPKMKQPKTHESKEIEKLMTFFKGGAPTP